MNAGPVLQHVSDELSKAKLRVDVMLIKRRVERADVLSARDALRSALTELDQLLGGRP